MTRDSTYERYGRPVLKVVILFLAATSLASAAAQLSTSGLAVIGDVLVSVYVTVLLVWGVFYEGLGTFRFRVALYAGVVLWGASEFLSGETGGFTWLLLGGGVLLLGQELFRKRHRDGQPVYDR